MDLMAAIGLLSSIVTLEEAGRSWVLIVKDKLKRKEIDINNWDSDDPLVQACLDRFKTDMGDKYKDHIFSEEEIQEIIRGFFEQNRELRIGNEEKKQMTQIIEDILYAYNEHTKSLMSSGERTLHNTLSSDFSKIMDKLGVIEEQPHKENIKKFLRAIEISKEIELENIEELINGEYEIDRSEIIETIQAGREKLVSIQGNAGSGKSVVCKKLLKGKEYVLVTRAENLSTGKKVNELWDCDVEDAILWLENKPLYIFIDAIEFIADCGDNAFTLLQEIYRLADKYSKDINNDLKQQILLMILKSIINDDNSGLISQIAELTKYFLAKNKNYASRIFNTIIMLAEDEMNHQKFNAAFIKENRNDAEYQFIPNMVPKLCGVDRWIQENNGNEYQNKRSEIIQEYLYDGKGIDLSEFDISNYDIDLLCNIACCGLDTADERFVIVINSIVQCMIEIWHENCKEMRAHEIIDTFQEHKVSSYFQRELNMTGRNPEAVYDILFKGTDFSIFTRDTVDFYEDVLSGFLVSYVDGFREKGKRDDIEKKIRILETYVNSITEDYVRNILEKRLFLCKGRFSRWDVNKVKAEYSYKDKCFLNVQIEKYGSNHLNDVLYTVYLLNISELLPEILISISSCFTKAIRNSKEQFAKEIIDSQVIVDMIILKSFIFYSDEIKKDEKLINAYEDILLALTEIRNEKAAVLLDEFRIH